MHTKWENYVHTTMQAFHYYFPVKSIPVHPTDGHWLSLRIKRLLHQRIKLFYTDPAEYRRIRNIVIREIKTTKKLFYPDKLHHLKHANSSQWFSKVKSLCGLQGKTTYLTFPTKRQRRLTVISLLSVKLSLLSTLICYLPTSLLLPHPQLSRRLRLLPEFRNIKQIDAPHQLTSL